MALFCIGSIICYCRSNCLRFANSDNNHTLCGLQKAHGERSIDLTSFHSNCAKRRIAAAHPLCNCIHLLHLSGFYLSRTPIKVALPARGLDLKQGFLDVAAVYVQELCTQVDSIRGRPRLRSASTGCIQLPGVQTSVAQRSFAYSGPAVWNSLPATPRDSSVSLHTFKRRLKTYFIAACLLRRFCEFGVVI